MANHPHIALHDFAESIEFKGQGGGGGKLVPPANPLEHSANLRLAYCSALDTLREAAGSVLPQGVVANAGAYVDISMDKNSPLESWKQLDTKRCVQLMNVRRHEDNSSVATVFIPASKDSWMNDKLDAYDVEPDQGKNRKSSAIVNAIKDIHATSLSSFFKNEEEFEQVTDVVSDYELWIPSTSDIDVVKTKIQELQVTVGNGVLAFEDEKVLLVKANKRQLEQLIHVVKPILEIRKYHCPSVLTSATMAEDREWEELIRQNVEVAAGHLSRIGLLDSGVNNSHSLLSDFLPNDRCKSVKNPALGLKDVAKHGTFSAGLVLYGDLSELICRPVISSITNELVSVKMYHDRATAETDQEHKAVITLNAIDSSIDLGGNIMMCSVTAEDCLSGMATATSAAIDKKLFDSVEADSMLMLSAGNRRNDNGLEYPYFLDTEVLHDPAQAWNALTVGAMTQKVAVNDPQMAGVRIVAPSGGPSPMTTSSSLWGDSNAIKPEIVMEGGNAYWQSENSFSYHDDLDLVSTNAQPIIRKFSSFNATSAAVALATKLAGEIKYYNPGISALSIRALMVHSAEWTDTMKTLYTDVDGILDKDALMHVCGYGTPNREKALMTTNSNVTFISEEVIKPYTLKANTSELSFAQMHLYKLPWPKEILQELGELSVKLKVTLSYYVEPSPGNREVLNKYKYPSTVLRFDVNRPLEDEEHFKVRVSNVAQEGIDKLKNDTSRWDIGINRRNHGSIHSDSIVDTAVNIAACNMIAIYPATGWWKSRKNKKDSIIKYSLVVSLEVPEVDIYTSIAQKIGIVIG
ncbi:MAG: S8 family peptidase [Bacteroidales bacterium]|nr:S8 family peptidase [Candidatus Liminaster caballi]